MAEKMVWDGRIWLSAEFSVAAETLCLHEPPAPNRDFRCVAAKGHKGRHQHRYAEGLYCYVPAAAGANLSEREGDGATLQNQDQPHV